ncbi:hypothetical protein EHQ92_15405 [Leptospira biflexa]|uniref:hypothetical protein n=1 Tax=Leptospira biflexa TaxID=172 RepID=UPI0010839B38|nr:hypothetical protein [Leptospira biflexa]TGM31969.1 hypothetical protein EHQ80_16855 [Leptospira biflexa]TGM39062.1 hypothetical protein EHQ89_07420 [Leptospira biflexa]TGM42718.1 hypothetical protein EHQ92_15405 [Leptospira biflexa]TGM45796.1 hypothetical protein EHQ88_13125 [Leptospira biflexa]
MFINGFYRFFLYVLILFGFLQCGISLRVYRPFPNEKEYDFVKKMDHIVIQVNGENRIQMAVYDSYFFGAESLTNEYGPLSYLIRKELSIRESRYPLLIERGGKILVEEFQLVSLDRCFRNLTFVRLKAKVQIRGYAEEEIQYYDEIDSKVTNCYLTGSVLTLVPLLWYVPYNGFRGNREDQLNQLGRNALTELFTKLEIHSGHLEKQTESQKMEDPKPMPKPVPTKQEPVDPKLKDILDSL